MAFAIFVLLCTVYLRLACQLKCRKALAVLPNFLIHRNGHKYKNLHLNLFIYFLSINRLHTLKTEIELLATFTVPNYVDILSNF